eukprot:CAMPEP_0180323472 /NCGR_PEP_ID=MMETSP0988-20121125/37322_1 /TAXON_ID=697907 /ORGANISM="non described non described, Strain CCMP2293" /LENGTH=93 /DNA_ID=CAMNT_0022309663 /DNA_START=190 /DNA_END=466 /DNA_ORIENTATION=-
MFMASDTPPVDTPPVDCTPVENVTGLALLSTSAHSDRSSDPDPDVLAAVEEADDLRVVELQLQLVLRSQHVLLRDGPVAILVKRVEALLHAQA